MILVTGRDIVYATHSLGWSRHTPMGLFHLFSSICKPLTHLSPYLFSINNLGFFFQWKTESIRKAIPQAFTATSTHLPATVSIFSSYVLAPSQGQSFLGKLNAISSHLLKDITPPILFLCFLKWKYFLLLWFMAPNIQTCYNFSYVRKASLYFLLLPVNVSYLLFEAKLLQRIIYTLFSIFLIEFTLVNLLLYHFTKIALLNHQLTPCCQK